MSRNTLITLSAVLLGSSVLATHVPVPLSSSFGGEVLTDVIYKLDVGGQPGVLAYVQGTEHETVHHLHDGYGFTVIDQDGNTESVTFETGDFADEHEVPVEDLVAVLNAKLGIAQASIENGHLYLRSLQGGEDASLELIDGEGSVLHAMMLPEGLHIGSADVRLTLSIPADDHGGDPGHEHEGFAQVDDPALLAGLPYVVVASSTDGHTHLGELALPFAWDSTSAKVFRATQLGLLDGFFGLLDETADGEAVLSQAMLETLFGVDLPDELYLAFAVLDPGASVPVYVSNRFTVHVEK